MDFSTSDTPARGSGKARRNASTTPAGFLRATTLLKSNEKRKTNPSGRPTAARSNATPGRIVTGVGM